MGVPGFLGINGIPVSMCTEAFFNSTSRSPWPSPHPVSSVEMHTIGFEAKCLHTLSQGLSYR